MAARSPMIWSDLRQDLRYGVRGLGRSPGFFAVAVLSIGLGIGATTSVFSIVDAVLLRPLPFHEPERLVWIANTGAGSGLSAVTSRASNLRDWRRLSRSLESLTGYSAFFDYDSYALIRDGDPERLNGVPVAQDFLDVLGVRPQIGRNFVYEESIQNGRRAVILSHGFWTRRFGADPGIVGTSITLNNASTVVVGVLPASFEFAPVFAPGARVDFLIPFPISEETDRSGNMLSIIGRLAPGATVEQAQADLDLVNQQLLAAEPGRWGLGASATRLDRQIRGSSWRALLTLAAAAGVVLLIVCTNMSNLLLARASTRRKEMAVRSAVGAGRSRLVRQLLTESLVLAGCGALLGVALANAITRVVANTPAFRMPRLEFATVDGVTLSFALGMAVLTGVAFGVLPAFQVSGVHARELLNAASRGSTGDRGRTWTRELLIVGEMALACLLVVASGLLLRSFVSVLNVELGFQPEQAVAWRIEVDRSVSMDQRRAFCERLLRGVRALPGVTSAGLTDTLPLGRNRSWTVGARGEVYGEGDAPTAFPRVVSPGYLETMGIRRLEGRTLSDRDTSEAGRVIVVNATMARQLWPGQEAVDRVAVINEAEWRVVGVVSDVRHGSLEKQGGLELYLPMTQEFRWGSLELVVRSSLPAGSLVPSVRGALRELDPTLPSAEFRTLEVVVDRAVAPRRFLLLLLGSFALAALLLAALGIYGVVSCSVGQRTQEIGIRMALGESRAQVQWRIVGRTLRLAGVGLLVGTLGSFGLSGLLSSLLFGVGPADPLTYGLMALTLTVVAAAAAYLPARRASRTDPARVLMSA